jgi:hypothetical protein
MKRRRCSITAPPATSPSPPRRRNVEVKTDNTTAGLGGDVCTPGPIMLQDHGNPVQFCNVWLVQK